MWGISHKNEDPQSSYTQALIYQVEQKVLIVEK